ncbi:MAG: flagellar hook capping protein [Planctomycetes bacterium]|nr:flagellar hook capping protein [Planctomycetota bacterium]
MMPNPISSLTSTTQTSAATGSTAERARLTRDEFMKILIAEVSNQDPMSPLDNKEFLGQLTNLQNLESTSALTDTLKTMNKYQELGAASTLIGKTITGTADSGNLVKGAVSKVVVNNDSISLVVGNETVALNNVQEVVAS